VTAGTLAWGCTAAALCVVVGMLIGWPIGYGRGWDHATEEAEWQRTDARWKGLSEEAARPVPVRPAAPPETPHAGSGKHRHPAGPRHAALPAALPVAGYLPAPDGPWDGTITVPAPAQQPPWDHRAPEPQTEVLEPTAVLTAPPPDPLSDSQFTRGMAADMDAWIREHIGAADSILKEITR